MYLSHEHCGMTLEVHPRSIGDVMRAVVHSSSTLFLPPPPCSTAVSNLRTNSGLEASIKRLINY